MADEVKLDWAQAAVKDGRLSVALEGEPPKAWKSSFENTVRLLAGGAWDEVELRKNTVHVSGLAPGSEDKLRHYLEGVVAQANAAQREEEHHEDHAEVEASGPDAEMTERFRAFAEERAERQDEGS